MGEKAAKAGGCIIYSVCVWNDVVMWMCLLGQQDDGLLFFSSSSWPHILSCHIHVLRESAQTRCHTLTILTILACFVRTTLVQLHGSKRNMT